MNSVKNIEVERGKRRSFIAEHEIRSYGFAGKERNKEKMDSGLMGMCRSNSQIVDFVITFMVSPG